MVGWRQLLSVNFTPKRKSYFQTSKLKNGIPERGERLLYVVIRRGHGGHHHGLAVAAQVLLQQPGQGRVAIWHKIVPGDKIT